MGALKPARAASTSESFDALTGLRGLAAVWVLVYHAWVLAGPRRLTIDLGALTIDLTPLCSLGWAGVQVFFVLSGFLLALPFARHRAGLTPPPKVRAYLVRRVARVFPAYWVQLAILLALASAAAGHLVLDLPALLGHLLMAFGPPPLGVGSPALNGTWWTLPVELSFYLLLPLLAPALTRTRVPLLLLACLGVMVTWRVVVTTLLADAPVPLRVLWSNQLPGSLDSFAIGAFGAVAHVQAERSPPLAARRHGRRVAAALALIIALLAWMHLQHDRYWSPSLLFVAWTPLFGLAVLQLVRAAAARWHPAELALGHGGVKALGVVSYGLYLWHLPVLEALLRSTPLGRYDGYRFPGLLAGGLAASLVLAAASWWLVERHAIAAARGLGRTRR